MSFFSLQLMKSINLIKLTVEPNLKCLLDTARGSIATIQFSHCTNSCHFINTIYKLKLYCKKKSFIIKKSLIVKKYIILIKINSQC